jgi:hypothetical protein
MFNDKKSQMFVFDLIFSFFIIIVSVGILYSYYYHIGYNNEIYSINKKIMNELTTVEVNSLNDENIRKLFTSGKIQNPKNTIAKQILEFSIDSNNQNSILLLNQTIKNLLPKNYNLKLTLLNLDNTLNMPIYSILNSKISKFNSTILTTNKKTILSFKNISKVYGPKILNLELWQ